MNNNGISFTCDSCGRQVFSCNIVNGMKFCAKCYQETFGNEQKYVNMLNKESRELLVNSLAEKDKQITELKSQLNDKKLLEDNYARLSERYDMLDSRHDVLVEENLTYEKKIDELQKQLEEKEKKIRQLDNEKGMLLNNSMKLLKEKDDKLHSQPTEIVEKIRKSIHYYPIALLDKDKNPTINTLGISKEVLDALLKEYQK